MNRKRPTWPTVACAAVLAGIACRGSEQQPAPAPTAPPTAPLAQPTPTIPPRRTPPPTLPAATPTPRVETLATPRPAPTLDTARLAALVTGGEQALAQGRLAEAERGFADALALDPANAQALRGKARTATTRLGLTRTLVPELPSSEGDEGRVTSLKGFDDVEKMDVRRAVKVPGRAELEGTLGHLKPGDPYTVQIFLRNQDRKKKQKIRIRNVKVLRVVNGVEQAVAVAWKPLELKARERGLVASLAGTWEDDVTSWALVVKLLSDGGDIYENRLQWK